MIRLTLLLFVCSISGCVPASVGQLPDEATDIEFDEDIDGQTGYRTAERSHTFEGARRETAFAAARAALVQQNYNVIVIDITKGAVIGKRGASTLFAGIYVSDSEADAQARIIVKTAVVFDPTLFGLPVAVHHVDVEAKKLLEAMELFIAAEISNTQDENSN